MAFQSKKAVIWSQLPSAYRLISLAFVLLAAGGCWEEIHYTPSEAPFARSEDTEPAEVLPTDPPVDEQPTGEVLFGEQPVEHAHEDEPDDEPDETLVQENPPTPPPSTEAQPEEASEEIFDDPFAEEESTPEQPEAEKAKEEEIVEPELAEILRPSRTALAAWRMSSRWSYAAAIYAKGLGKDYYSDPLQQAEYAADLLEMKLPEFPEIEAADRQNAMIGFLLQAGRSQIAEELSAKFSPEYTALSELAIKTNVLLLVYTPKSPHLEPIVAAIRQAAENSTLPSTLWSSLVDLLEQRAPFTEVKSAVLQLHQQVADYLGGS